MDTIDVKILRALMMGGASFVGNDIRRSYRTVAARVGVSEDTVRVRVEKFRAKGMIQAWRVGMNPSIFGRRASFLFFDVGPRVSKDDALRRIRLINGVLFVLSYFGNSLGVHLTYGSDDAFRKERELIAGIADAREIVSMKVSSPSLSVRLTSTDWGLIGALRASPRRSFDAIGRELGVSSRTAKRRVERMIQAGVLYTLPDIDPKSITGLVMSSLSVYYSRPSAAPIVAKAIISQFDDYLILFHAADTEHGWFGFALPNVAKANEIEKQARGMSGVRGTSMRLVEGFVNLIDEAFDDEIREKVAMSMPAVRPARP